jgi:hypothetical protein
MTVLDRTRPVACSNPLPREPEYVHRKGVDYSFQPLGFLMAGDPLLFLEEERGDR